MTPTNNTLRTKCIDDITSTLSTIGIDDITSTHATCVLLVSSILIILSMLIVCVIKYDDDTYMLYAI
jgi:hypothetical protein